MCVYLYVYMCGWRPIIGIIITNCIQKQTLNLLKKNANNIHEQFYSAVIFQQFSYFHAAQSILVATNKSLNEPILPCIIIT